MVFVLTPVTRKRDNLELLEPVLQSPGHSSNALPDLSYQQAQVFIS